MAALYEIENQIQDLIAKAFDPETGELIDTDAVDQLDELEMERDRKIENIALYIKNLRSDAVQYKAEKEIFAKKQKSAENRADSLEAYLQGFLHGEKYKSTKVSITYRTSQSVHIDCEPWLLPDKFQKVEYSADKTELKKALKNGEQISGVWLSDNISMQIK